LRNHLGTTGAAVGYGVVFGVILGTGVGGGIIIDGKIHRGRTYIAGEWGHHTLHQNGNKCYCGRFGCVETYISGPALEKRWSELTGRTKSLTSIVQNLNSDEAQQWKKEFLENFGMGLANVIDILDPDVIVLGGGVSNVDFLYTEGRNAVYGQVFSDLVDTPILKNKLGDSAGVFGAALLI
jgi:fructokinase